METSTTLKVSAALKEAQAKFDTIVKDTDNPFFKSKFAKLDQVIDATRPHLTDAGLVLTQKNVRDGDRYGIETTLLHLESGEQLTSYLLAKPEKDTIQQVASILTYARRYEYLTILGLAPEDDDGAEASGTSVPKSERQTYSQSAQPHPAAKGAPAKSTLGATPNTTSTAIRGDSSHVPASAGLGSHAAKPQLAAKVTTPAESASSSNPARLPTKAEYEAFIARSLKIVESLENAGLTNSKGLPARTKFKKYICSEFKVADPKELQFGMFESILGTFEKRDAKESAKLVEVASEKETK